MYQPHLRWALAYPTRTLVEPLDCDTSILTAPLDATMLYGLYPDDSVALSFDLRKGGHTWRPVFYRHRTLTDGGATDVYPVFGRVRPCGAGPCWDVVTVRDGRVVACPPFAVTAAINLMLRL